MPFLKDFYKIYKFNDEKKLHNFTLIPQFHAARQYVTYHREAFHSLLCSIGECPKKPNPNGGRDIQQKPNEINMTEFLNVKANGFANSFSTDGIACSVKYNKPKKKKKTSSNTTISKPKPTEAYVGLDPGNRLFVAGVRIKPEGKPIFYNEPGVFKHIKITSKQYHYNCKLNSHRVRRIKLNRKIEEEIEDARKGIIVANI